FATVADVAGRSFGTEYGKRFVAENPDTEAVLDYLLSQMQLAKDEPARRREIAAVLRDDRFKGNFKTRRGLQLDPDGALATGKPMFAFEAAPVAGDHADPSRVLTFANSEKKVYLLDVWATWCKPCVAELPQLQELHDKYGSKKAKKKNGKRLEIVSMSI